VFSITAPGYCAVFLFITQHNSQQENMEWIRNPDNIRSKT